MMTDAKRKAFISEHVAATAPIPCEFVQGDTVTVLNGMGVEIQGKKILGFVREIDPEWRPKAFVYLDWDCYWFPVEVERLTLENQDVCSSCNSPAEKIIGCPDGAELCSQCFDNSNH